MRVLELITSRSHARQVARVWGRLYSLSGFGALGVPLLAANLNASTGTYRSSAVVSAVAFTFCPVLLTAYLWSTGRISLIWRSATLGRESPARSRSASVTPLESSEHSSGLGKEGAGN